MKKTLITKFTTDVTYANDAQIEAFKAFWRATFAPAGIAPDFEVLTEHEEDTVEHMLHLVRSEFQAHDGEIEVIAERNDPDYEH